MAFFTVNIYTAIKVISCNANQPGSKAQWCNSYDHNI